MRWIGIGLWVLAGMFVLRACGSLAREYNLSQQGLGDPLQGINDALLFGFMAVLLAVPAAIVSWARRNSGQPRQSRSGSGLKMPRGPGNKS